MKNPFKRNKDIFTALGLVKYLKVYDIFEVKAEIPHHAVKEGIVTITIKAKRLKNDQYTQNK
jgi:hypothetical protein